MGILLGKSMNINPIKKIQYKPYKKLTKDEITRIIAEKINKGY